MTNQSSSVSYVYDYLNLDDVQNAAIRGGILARTEWQGLGWTRLLFPSYANWFWFKMCWQGHPSVHVQADGPLPTGEFAIRITGWIPLKVFEWLDLNVPNDHHWCGPTAVNFVSEDDRALFEAVL
jgi:hypothetical protein